MIIINNPLTHSDSFDFVVYYIQLIPCHNVALSAVIIVINMVGLELQPGTK